MIWALSERGKIEALSLHLLSFIPSPCTRSLIVDRAVTIGPFLYDCRRNVPDQDVDMFHSRHALQRCPVLEVNVLSPSPGKSLTRSLNLD